MFTPLRLTSTLDVPPLLDLSYEEIAVAYHQGMSEGIRCNAEPITLTSLLTSLKEAIEGQVFDGQHKAEAGHFVGLHLGRIHGAVLTAQGTLRSGITTLVTLDCKEGQRGYQAGRHWFFEEAAPHERRYTDDALLERFLELVREAPEWHDDSESIWQFVLGCLMGELSGQVFPVTPQERAYWA